MEIEDKLSEFLDDPDFLEIDRRMARFNLFEAMGAVRGELRHSNFLAFILSPARSHGYGASVLLAFLRSALDKLDRPLRPVRPLDLILGDLDDAVVYRERYNIDLLIEVKNLRLVVLIENKIDARAGDGQLERYKQTLVRYYPHFRHLLVFLTPDGTTADEPDYASLGYEELARVIGEVQRDRGASSSNDANTILRHYVEMIRKHIVPDKELNELARRVYERHREALDFIIECRPEPESLLNIVHSLLDDSSGLVMDQHGSSIIRFVPETWTNIPELNSTDASSWTKTGRSLIFEVKGWSSGHYKDRVIVSLVIGPSPQETREKLYRAAASQPDLFKNLVKPMGKKWATIFMRELLSPAAAKNMNSDEKADAIELNWAAFQAEELPELTAAVLNVVDNSHSAPQEPGLARPNL
jgi:PD-(D/E)XK nuclease superfamily